MRLQRREYSRAAHLTTGNGLSADAVQLYERRLLAIQTDGTDAGMAAVSAQLLAAHPTVARLKIVCEDRGIPVKNHKQPETVACD